MTIVDRWDRLIWDKMGCGYGFCGSVRMEEALSTFNTKVAGPGGLRICQQALNDEIDDRTH
jgi:hypothetical protein